MLKSLAFSRAFLKPVRHLLTRNVSGGKVLDISGIYPPIATAFYQDERVANDKIQENMEKWNTIDFRGTVNG